jgi:3-methyladenine DNA glycosylase AlkD
MTLNPVPELALHPSTSTADTVAQITKAFERLSGDDSYREGMTRAVPGVRDVYGVRVPQLRALARQVIKVLGKKDGAVEAIADECWRIGSREHCVLGILMLSGLKTLTPAQRWTLGIGYLPEVGDWETCDQLCMGLLGQALADDPTYMQDLEGWVDDPNFWVRRAALASTVVLRRSKAAPDIRASLDKRTLGICLHLLDDAEHYVRNAVDWAVREVIRRDYDLGQNWVMERSLTELSSVARSTLKKAAKKLSSRDQDQFLNNLS